jgi:hypothetical protein
MDVVLQAWPFVNAAEVDRTRGHFEESMDEVHQTVCEIPRKIRSVIGAPVLAKTPCHVHSRIFLARQLDIRIGLVIAQQDVVSGLVLLNEIVLKRERFLVVVDLDEVDIPSLTDQGSRFSVSKPVLVEVAPDARTKALGFSDINDFPVPLFVLIHAWQGR